MNNSPLRKYFGQNYGRREDDLEQRVIALEPLAYFRGTRIFKSQYDALLHFSEQYRLQPTELPAVHIESGMVTKLYADFKSIQTNDKSLIVPPALSALQVLNCANNYLHSLVIPDELTALRELQCYSNNLTSLVLPKELKSLQLLDCRFNAISSMRLPSHLTDLKTVYCYGNESFPRQVIDDLVFRGVIVNE